LLPDWKSFCTLVKSVKSQLGHLKTNLLFAFVEGLLVQAITNGDWILLDEINLATSEVLESLSGLLQSTTESIILLERGDTKPLKRHPNFRLFACMNPATDVGKRDLPLGLRSRFTEFWVEPQDAIRSDLILIIQRQLGNYLPPASSGGEIIVQGIADFHLLARKASENGQLVDGAGQKNHVNIRMLTRALAFAAEFAPVFGLPRALHEGVTMAYITMLGKDSMEYLEPLVERHIMNVFPTKLRKITSTHGTAFDNDRMLVGSFWIRRGDLPEELISSYILTPGVERNLFALTRAVMCARYPVLIQGPTSAGKTSIIEYLAKRAGHRFVRVNNHEHTDLQEYLGSYVSDAEGRLVFKEASWLFISYPP
jgi:midasin